MVRARPTPTVTSLRDASSAVCCLQLLLPAAGADARAGADANGPFFRCMLPAATTSLLLPVVLLLSFSPLLPMAPGALQRIVQDAGAGVVLEKAKLDEVRCHMRCHNR